MGRSLDEMMRMPVDLQHYEKHKERLDRDIKDAMEAGVAQKFGIPPGFPSEGMIKKAIIMCDKYPELGKVDPQVGKPLTGSQKRKHKRFDRNAEPDEVVEYELEEAEGEITGDKQFRIVSAEDYKPPPTTKYVKDGKVMPDGFEPFKALPEGPLPDAIKNLPSIENGGTPKATS